MKRWIASILSLALLCNTFAPAVWAEDAASAVPEIEVTEPAEEPSHDPAAIIPGEPAEAPSGEELPAAEENLSAQEITEQAEVPPLAAGNEAPAAEQVESMDASDYIFQAGGTQSTGGGNIMLLDLYDEDIIAALEALIYPALQNRIVVVPIESLGMPNNDHSKSLILTAFSNIVNSHPELYYVNNTYSMYSNGTHFTRIVFDLLYTDEQIDSYNSQLQAAIKKAKSYVLPGMSHLQIAMVLHDYLALTNHYNAKVASGQKADNNQVYDIIGALLNGDAVCQGYTLAYELLLNEYGIENSTVSSNAINHIWNQVCLDGNWYNVDVTWDDPVPDVPGRVCHDQFLRTDETFVDHRKDLTKEEWTRKHYCTDETYNSDDVFWRGSQSAIVYGVMDNTLQTYYVNNAGQVIRQPADPEQEPETYPIVETWYANVEMTSYWPSHFRLIPAPNSAAYLMGAKNIYGINLNKGVFSEPLHTMDEFAAANFCYYGIQLTADNQLELYANNDPNYAPPLVETIPAPEIPGLDIMFCGENITWSLSNGVLTLTGTGATYDYAVGSNVNSINPPWYASSTDICKIVVEEGITGLGDNIFKNLTNVSVVELPCSIVYIGAEAFFGCPVNAVYCSDPESLRKNVEICEGNADFENVIWRYKSICSADFETVTVNGQPCLEVTADRLDAAALVSRLLNRNEIRVLDAAGQPLDSDMYVGTGCTVQFADDSDISAVVVIPGDIDGDGSMNMNDIVLARRAVLGYETFSGVYLTAATPASGADKPTLSDVTAMRRYCLGVTDSLRLYGVA